VSGEPADEADRAKIVPLVRRGDAWVRPEPGGEVTVYVKGFLARGEEPDHFEGWLASHGEAAARHGWSSGALGYCWPSGSVGAPPLPFASAAKIAWDVVRSVRGLRKFNVASAVAMTAGEEVARVALRFVGEYRAAERAARERASDLAAVLGELAERHARVRVVAHSLGARHAIEAIGALPASSRPHEVHLCAAACREEEVGSALSGLARERAHLYFSTGDLVLRTGFALLSGGSAIGAAGLARSHAGLDAWDVSPHFDFWVHSEYKKTFGKIAR